MEKHFRQFDHIDIGATLYTPSINKKLGEIASGKKFPHVITLIPEINSL